MASAELLVLAHKYKTGEISKQQLVEKLSQIAKKRADTVIHGMFKLDDSNSVLETENEQSSSRSSSKQSLTNDQRRELLHRIISDSKTSIKRDIPTSQEETSNKVAEAKEIDTVTWEHQRHKYFDSEEPFEFQLTKRNLDNKTEAIEEALRRQETEECTFSPTINNYTSADNKSRNSSFFERSLKWKVSKQCVSALDDISKEQKDAKVLAKQKKQLDKEDLTECTFKPKTNPVVAYVPMETSSQRLQTNTAQKWKDLEHEKKLREENEVRQTCTFKPQLTQYNKINNSSHGNSVKPRYRDPTPTKKRTSDSETFKPAVNKVSKEMVSAKMYLSVDPFERLSRSNKSIDLDTGGSLAHRPSSAPIAQSKKPSSISEQTNTSSFSQFLQRQQDHILKKEHDQARLQEQMQGHHTPSICRKSVAISKKKGSFLERLQQQDHKKSEEHQIADNSDNQFQPKILESSKRLRRRSWAEMSTGDQMKREALREAARQKAFQEELHGVTFHPRLNSSSGVQSKLKILTEPDTYLERLQRENDVKEQQALNNLIKKSQSEIEQCTFKPEIHDAPEYVKNINRSRQFLKQQQRH